MTMNAEISSMTIAKPGPTLIRSEAEESKVLAKSSHHCWLVTFKSEGMNFKSPKRVAEAQMAPTICAIA